MAYHIEVISVGGAFDKDIEEAAQVLNGCQKEFVFAPPPERLRAEGAPQVATSYATSDLWDFLRQYRRRPTAWGLFKGATMWRTKPTWHALPMSGDGERPLSVAWRVVHRCSYA